MAYSALKLITRAYYASGVVSRELQTVSGSQIQDGLELLNAILDFKGTDLRLIPYWTRDSFDTIAGEEKYHIENLIEIDATSFDLDSVRYPMQSQTRYEYFGTARVNNIESLPFNWRAERVLGGMDIYLYYVPNQVYTVNYSGKFALSNVTLVTDLSLTYDPYYIQYLWLALAEFICIDNLVSLPPQTKAKLEEMRKKLMDVSPFDLSMRKQSFFDNSATINYAIANLSGGWVPK
jgi:hypothetical protein